MLLSSRYVRPTDTVVDAFGLVRRIWADDTGFTDQIYGARFDLTAPTIVEKVAIWLKNDGSSAGDIFANLAYDGGSNAPDDILQPIAFGSRFWSGSTALSLIEVSMAPFTGGPGPVSITTGTYWVLLFPSALNKSYDSPLYSVPVAAGPNSKYRGSAWSAYGSSPPQTGGDYGAIDILLGILAFAGHSSAQVIG